MGGDILIAEQIKNAGDNLMAEQFEFLFDVGAPNAYLVHKILPEFCAAHHAEAIYTPILLGGVFKATGNRAPMIRYADAPAKLAYEQLEFSRFIKANRITTFRMNPHFPVNSLLAMRTIAAAQDTPDFAPTIDVLMRGMWEDGLDLAQPDVVSAALDRAGLNGRALIAKADDAETKARLSAQTESAVARGVFGVPTFFVGAEMFWGKERLGQVAEALA
jgi:2-hydroxychromene-2-carboxylate isomerase